MRPLLRGVCCTLLVSLALGAEEILRFQVDMTKATATVTPIDHEAQLRWEVIINSVLFSPLAKRSIRLSQAWPAHTNGKARGQLAQGRGAPPRSRAVFSCATFADGASMVLEKAGLKKATCFTDSIEHPGEAPGTSDPEMIVTSCPDFLLYIGWDRDKERTMGNMRQELLLKTNAAVKAIAEGFKQ